MAEHTPTPDEIAELRRLCAEATPGPWQHGVDGNQRIYGPDRRGYYSGIVAASVRRSDAAFIAAAREWLPRLLDIAERREAAQANLDRAASDTIRDLMAALEHVVEERDTAYTAGAEAMRETCAIVAQSRIGMPIADIAAAIRSAPLPERKESEG